MCHVFEILTLSIWSPSLIPPSWAARLLPTICFMYNLQPRTSPNSENTEIRGMLKKIMKGYQHNVIKTSIELIHRGQDRMAAVLQLHFQMHFLEWKWLCCYSNFTEMFPVVHLSICQHWLRWWLGAAQATSHYLIQWWPISVSSPTHFNEFIDARITWPHWV